MYFEKQGPYVQQVHCSEALDSIGLLFNVATVHVHQWKAMETLYRNGLWQTSWKLVLKRTGAFRIRYQDASASLFIHRFRIFK